MSEKAAEKAEEIAEQERRKRLERLGLDPDESEVPFSTQPFDDDDITNELYSDDFLEYLEELEKSEDLES